MLSLSNDTLDPALPERFIRYIDRKRTTGELRNCWATATLEIRIRNQDKLHILSYSDYDRSGAVRFDPMIAP
jgi:hypothetical protein